MPTFLAANPPNIYCCRLINTGCPWISWAQFCDGQPVNSQHLCDNKTDVKNELPLSPMFIHTYTGAGTTQELWVGVSIANAGICDSYETHNIEIPPAVGPLPENFLIKIE